MKPLLLLVAILTSGVATAENRYEITLDNISFGPMLVSPITDVDLHIGDPRLRAQLHERLTSLIHEAGISTAHGRQILHLTVDLRPGPASSNSRALLVALRVIEPARLYLGGQDVALCPQFVVWYRHSLSSIPAESEAFPQSELDRLLANTSEELLKDFLAKIKGLAPLRPSEHIECPESTTGAGA